MITRASTVGIYVSDQDRALDFYTGKLDFEKLTDDPMGGGARWIEGGDSGAIGPRLCKILDANFRERPF